MTLSGARSSSAPSSPPPPGGRLSLPLWRERYAAPLAPTTRAEMLARGWDAVDIVFVSGDAYVDHPSFAAAIAAFCPPGPEPMTTRS